MKKILIPTIVLPYTVVAIAVATFLIVGDVGRIEDVVAEFETAYTDVTQIEDFVEAAVVTYDLCTPSFRARSSFNEFVLSGRNTIDVPGARIGNTEGLEIHTQKIAAVGDLAVATVRVLVDDESPETGAFVFVREEGRWWLDCEWLQ